MEISVIYEDENILAVNKPAGIAVHPDGRTKEYTLSDWVAENYPSTRGVGEPIKLTHGLPTAQAGPPERGRLSVRSPATHSVKDNTGIST